LIFSETELSGAYIIDVEPIKDERGFFARSWCRKEFEKQGLNGELLQCNISYNKKKGTLRGMHFQWPPYGEAKLVRCVHGAIYDVIVDLRPSSATYCRWQSVELNEKNRRALYIPEGFAHGFLTLTDKAEVSYQMSSEFVSGYDAGIRWDDPTIDISWPDQPKCISEKDLTYPDFIMN
jgi:dTDP-4-dehydrorhamnose 3,5-epimerase